MSDERCRPSQVDALLLGQAGERHVMATGWIGEHPVDDGDVAHLLLYPAGHGVAGKMRTLAEGLGLGAADAGVPLVEVDPDHAHAWLDEDSHVHVQGPGGEVAVVPVQGAWWAAATTRRFLVLSIGHDPLTWRAGDFAALDRYLARTSRYHVGRIEVAEP